MVRKKRIEIGYSGMVILRGRRNMLGWLLFACLSLVLEHHDLLAQDVRATANVDSNHITIGDWLNLRLEVEHPANVSVIWPQLADSLQGLEIVRRGERTSRQAGQNILESAMLTVTGYDSGTFVIPPLPFLYSTAGDSSKKVAETSPVLIRIHGVPVDTAKDIRDIKPPLTLSITFLEILPYLAAILILGGLAWLLYYISKKRRRGESIFPETPRRPAHEVALEALRALEAERLWQRGKIKEYYSQVTDIVRVYIERRFDVMAMELTTDEILSSSVMQLMEKGAKEILKEILVRADLVKFAKFQPRPEENETSLASAISFVEMTRSSTEESNAEEAPVEMKA